MTQSLKERLLAVESSTSSAALLKSQDQNDV